jgi:DeoR family glycerol-3-phosphate regulon repressor
MTPNPRQTLLLEEVTTRGSVTVEALADRLGVTLQTVRSDVALLAEAGLLARFHGGVRVPGSTTENIAYGQRQQLNAGGQARIARAWRRRCPNGCSLILNIGTTTEAVARELLRHRGLRVITNNLNVAMPSCRTTPTARSSSPAAWCARATAASSARRRSTSSGSSRSTSA